MAVMESWTQTSFWLRDDDGSETGATFLGSIGTNQALAFDTNYRVRFLISGTHTGGSGSFAFVGGFQYQVDGGTWTPITTTSSNVRAVASADTSWTITDDDATTEQMSGAATFVAGHMDETGTCSSVDISETQESEFELVFQLRSADLTGSETIGIRMVDSGTALDVYAVGSIPSLTIDAGVTKEPGVVDPGLDLTGQAPTLDLAIEPAVVATGLDLTGQAPTVFREDYVNPAQVELRAFSVRGLYLNTLTPTIDVTTSDSVERFPTEETLALSGQAPTVHWTITPGVVDPGLDLAGQAPTRRVTILRDIPVVDPGLDLAGQAPTLLWTVFPSVVDPGLDLVGQAPSLDLTTSPAVVDPGLDLAGQAPTVHWTITPGVVDLGLDLTGQAPTVERDYTIEVGVVSPGLDLTGKEPTADSGGNVTRIPDPDTLDLTGQIPTVHWTITPGVVSPGLDLTGQAPEAISDNSVTRDPAEYDLSLTGQAPTVERDFFPTIGEVALSLSGQTPVVTEDSPLDIVVPSVDLRLFSVRGLQFRGITPTVIGGDVPYIPAANLAITGQVPDVPFFIPGAGNLDTAGQTVRKKFGFSLSIPVPEGNVSFTEQQPARAVGLDLRGYAPDYGIAQGGNPYRFPPRRSVTLTGQDVVINNTSPISYQVPVPIRPAFLFTDEPVLETFDPALPPSLTLNMMQPQAIASDPIFYPAAEQLVLTLKLPFINPLIIPDAGTLVVTGKTPVLDLSDNKLPSPTEGTLTVSGSAPLVYPNPLAQPGVGSVTLSTSAPSISWTVKVTLVRKLRITGKQPTRTDFGVDVPRSPLRRQLRIQSNDPIAANVGVTRQVAIKTATISGKAPGVDLDTDAAPVARIGALNLTPGIPTVKVDRKIAIGKTTLVITEKGLATQEKRYRNYGARTRLVRLTTKYSLEILYR